MKIPKFIPMVESERKSREWSGFFLEVLVWAYVSVVAARILFWGIFLPKVEDLAFADEPVQWAVNLVEVAGYGRYAEFSWSALGVCFLVGGVIGALVGLTGRGMGSWLFCSFSDSRNRLGAHKN
jgi:phosphonate transport system permease protein